MPHLRRDDVPEDAVPAHRRQVAASDRRAERPANSRAPPLRAASTRARRCPRYAQGNWLTGSSARNNASRAVSSTAWAETIASNVANAVHTVRRSSGRTPNQRLMDFAVSPVATRAHCAPHHERFPCHGLIGRSYEIRVGKRWLPSTNYNKHRLGLPEPTISRPSQIGLALAFRSGTMRATHARHLSAPQTRAGHLLVCLWLAG